MLSGASLTIHIASVFMAVLIVFYYWLYTISSARTHKYTGIIMHPLIYRYMWINIAICIASIVLNLIFIIMQLF